MSRIALQVPERVPKRRAFLTAAKWNALVVPLREQLVGELRPSLRALFAAVALLLLIACGNVMNLLLSRGNKRQKEIALRSALGASRGRIARQLIVESVVLSVFGGMLGLALAYWGAAAARSLGPSSAPLLDRTVVDIPVLAFLTGMAILTGILFGLAPAWQLMRTDPQAFLKDGQRTSQAAGPHRTAGSLVIVEVAVSLILVAGTGLMLRSLNKITGVDPGFQSANRLTFSIVLPSMRYKAPQRAIFVKSLMERMQSLPGVSAVGLIHSLPLAGTNDTSTVAVKEHPTPSGSPRPSTEYRMITPGYIRAMGIPLLKGRDFVEQDNAQSRRVALIDERAAKDFWPGEEPLGREISFGDENWAEIVGVVGSVRNAGLDAVSLPQLYIPYAQDSTPQFYVVLKTSVPPAELTKPVREAAATLDRSLAVFDIRTMDDRISASLSRRRGAVVLMVAFALVALVLASVGIYGVIAFSVSGRMQEFGIRMALGADAGTVLRLVLLHGMKLAAVGVALGVAGAMATNRLLKGLLFGIQPDDPLTMGAVIILLCAVALLACYVPARRATRVDPMIALRYE